MDQAILEREALKLPVHERALLADALLGSLDDEATRQTEAACAAEVENRREAYLRGELKASLGSSVFERLRSKHAK